ncbi:MAG: peptidylprolyl isomerase [Planctomycetes bacterium]|nr:peptidylprolyl isomerase [Planctomycetota bacterium]
MEITKDKIVAFDYTLTDAEGRVLDTSEGRAPLAYLHGHGGIIPGLEAELEGKQAGDALKVTVPPEKAYGPRNDQLLNRVPKEAFAGQLEFELGLQFPVRDQNGNQLLVTIVHIEDDAVILDANHPLAGVELTFDVTIVEVREATAEELEHGHVHGAGGHHH